MKKFLLLLLVLFFNKSILYANDFYINNLITALNDIESAFLCDTNRKPTRVTLSMYQNLRKDKMQNIENYPLNDIIEVKFSQIIINNSGRKVPIKYSLVLEKIKTTNFPGYCYATTKYSIVNVITREKLEYESKNIRDEIEDYMFVKSTIADDNNHTVFAMTELENYGPTNLGKNLKIYESKHVKLESDNLYYEVATNKLANGVIFDNYGYDDKIIKIENGKKIDIETLKLLENDKKLDIKGLKTDINVLKLKGITLGDHYSNYNFKEIYKPFTSIEKYNGYIKDEKYAKIWTEINKDGIIERIATTSVSSKSKDMCQKDFNEAVEHINEKYSNSYPTNLRYSSSKLFDETAPKDRASIEIGNPEIAQYFFEYSLKPRYFTTQYENHCEISIQVFKK